MTQYIEKDRIVAEIKRQISAIDDCPKITNTQISVLEGDKVVLTKLLSFIDTLEMKEVDFEKEIDSIEDRYHGFESLSRNDVIDIVRHFANWQKKQMMR